jgi:MFS family permease
MAKASTWLALRNPVFRRLWLAMVASGSCIGAHNTAVYWALDSLGASTVVISLMATVSALPYTLFTLPAGAIADMVDRKKILLAVQLWHASVAIALAILWMAHLLNPYLILASAFLFSAGFAFGSPAHSSVIAEIVSTEELGSAYTLAGLQMDLSGIIGPLFAGLLIPLAGASFIFGVNGLGFLFMFLAFLQWKRVRAQSNLPLENFFESNQPNKFRMEVVVPSWKQHLLQRERMTKTEKEVIDKLRSLRTDPNPPEEWVSLSVEKEVLNKRIRSAGLPPDYVDR